MKNQTFEQFNTSGYSVNKTIASDIVFEESVLKKIAKFIENDIELSKDFIQVKKLIDTYHVYFINMVLGTTRLKEEELNELYLLISKKDRTDKEKERIDELSLVLEKQISFSYTKSKNENISNIFNVLFKEKIIKEVMIDFVTEEKDKELLKKFFGFYSMFDNYNESRKNIYNFGKKSSISHRTIIENFPKFCFNINSFSKAKSLIDFSQVENQMEDVLQGTTLNELFSVSNFNNHLNQNGIELYNSILGGRTIDEGETKIKGINELINEYNQKQKEKKSRIPKLKFLYKQILSEEESISFSHNAYCSYQEMIQDINIFFSKALETNLFENIKMLFAGDMFSFDKKGIILNSKSYDLISQRAYSFHGAISNALREDYERNFPRKPKENIDKYEVKIKKFIAENHNIHYLQDVIKKSSFDLENKENLIVKYLSSFSAKGKDLLHEVYVNYESVSSIIESRDYNNQIQRDNNSKILLNKFMSSVFEFYNFLKPFVIENEETYVLDANFYDYFRPLFEDLKKFVSIYNKTRNFVTKKPYETKKVKLYFENNGKFGGGFSESKTDNSDNGTQYGIHILRKKNEINEYDMFVGISKDAYILRCPDENSNVYNMPEEERSGYERMEFYQMKSMNVFNMYSGENSYDTDKKALIKLIYDFVEKHDAVAFAEIKKYTEKEEEKATPGKCISLIKNKNTISLLKMDNDFSMLNSKIINNLKETVKSLTRISKNQIVIDVINKQYDMFNEIIEDIMKFNQIKTISFFPISKQEMELVTKRAEKQLFLGKLTNKDLSYSETFTQGKRKNRGNGKTHSAIFKTLFSVYSKLYFQMDKPLSHQVQQNCSLGQSQYFIQKIK